jgi:Tfp pilus assembly protein PilO
MEKKKNNKIDLLKVIRETSEKKMSYIFTGITVAVAIILIVGAIRPTVITITRINSEISTKEKTDEALSEKINALSELDTQYYELKNDFRNISLVFPTENNFSLFMANIDAVSSRNGFVLMGLAFFEYKDDNPIATTVLEPWSVRLTVEGKRANLVNLLRDLESLPMYPVIESLSYSDKSETEETTSFTINMRIYHVSVNNFYD